MFERFEQSALTLVADAYAHARRLGHDYIGCEHLLLAAASTDDVGAVLRTVGVAPSAVETMAVRLLGGPVPGTLDADALAAIGIDLEAVRHRVEASFGKDALSPHPPPHRRLFRPRRRTCGDPDPDGTGLPFSDRAKACLQHSLGEAQSLQRSSVSAEHIALALTAMTNGLAPQVFAAIGTTPELVRTTLLEHYRPTL